VRSTELATIEFGQAERATVATIGGEVDLPTPIGCSTS